MLKIISSLKIDDIIQGFLFLILLLTMYGLLPALSLVLSPIMLLTIIIKSIYDFFENENINFA